MNLATLNTGVEFERVSVSWKGATYDFFCKVLSSKEHRAVTDYLTKDGTVDLNRYRAMTDHFISACVHIPAEDAKQPGKVVEWTDEEGETHSLVQWLAPSDAAKLKAALAHKLRAEVEKVNSLQGVTEGEGEDELGNL